MRECGRRSTHLPRAVLVRAARRSQRARPHLLEGVARVDELVHAEEGGAAARVPLRPLGLQPYALVGVAEGAVVLLEGHVRRRAVRVEDVVLGVELDRLLEQVDGAAVVLLVERLDRALLRLERLALPRHLLGDRVHHRLQLLLEGLSTQGRERG